jgi:nucleoside-diphosphate-sugar epimerase
MPAQAVPLLVTGSTGRLGGYLRRLWPFALKGGLRPVWQARDGRPGCLGWDILHDPAPPWAGGVVLALAGGRGEPDVNTALALATLRAARAQGARHVFLASSSAVYAPGADLGEDTSPAPPNAYGAAKLAMERAALAEGGVPLTILRIGNVAGADALLGRASGEVVLDPVNDGAGPIRSYIGPVSFAAVLARLAQLAAEGRALPQVLNLAAPRPVSMRALLEAAGLPWRAGPENPAAVPVVTLDTARLQALMRLPPPASQPAGIVAEWRQAQALR